MCVCVCVCVWVVLTVAVVVATGQKCRLRGSVFCSHTVCCKVREGGGGEGGRGGGEVERG